MPNMLRKSSSKTATPPLATTPLPSTPPMPDSKPSFFNRPRGHSTSTIRHVPLEEPLQRVQSRPTERPQTERVTSAPLETTTSSATLLASSTSTLMGREASTFRSRAGSYASRDRSPLRGSGIRVATTSIGVDTLSDGAPSTWWNRSELSPRPWKDTPKRKDTVPGEQTEAWADTRQHVARAAASVLGTAGDIVHEALMLSVDVLGFVPIPGLGEAAKMLLNIWDILQLVDMNRLACLRLVERCATILMSVREEIRDAGDSVGRELMSPIRKLVEEFTRVHLFLQKQTHRPFLKRYLKRDEILKQISGLDGDLNEALDMFSLSIQIRILKQVQNAERQRHADTQAILQSIASHTAPHTSPPRNALELTGVDEEDTATFENPWTGGSILSSPMMPTPSTLSPGSSSPIQIRHALRSLHTRQNELDYAHDHVDLRQLMRAALSTSSDVEMIEVLQIGRDEMPEALKTLQRALEKEMESNVSPPSAPVAVEERAEKLHRRTSSTGKVSSPRMGVRKRLSMHTSPNPPPAAFPLERSSTVKSIATIESKAASSGSERKNQDTLDREFMESGIDALRRLSKSAEVSLPSWTITRYEVDREEKIGIGFFSDVYKGTWRQRTVAIKVLAPTTPRTLFTHEIEIWKTLKHPNVVELFGASSASGDPPWFFVSPYYKHGSLVFYLKGLNHRGWEQADTLKMMHEIAKGMQYLHARGVLHGDLKAANVLVDDRTRCVISDFGQSEMKSEAYRISGTPMPHGTLRWQAPELLEGMQELTTEIDVYAFAISCAEVLTKGSMPWGLADDNTVRHFVLEKNQRPSLPLTRMSVPAIAELLRVAWHRDPFQRPTFSKIASDLKQMRVNAGSSMDREESPLPSVTEFKRSHESRSRPSPDMHPIPLPPQVGDVTSMTGISPSTSDSSWVTAPSGASPTRGTFDFSGRSQSLSGPIQMPIPVLYTPSVNSSMSSIFTSTPDTQSENNVDFPDYTGYDSPPPYNDHAASARNERRYRMLLSHEFHPSLTLPLWTPSPIALGAVGFLSKPSGEFVTLFNSLDPGKSSDGRVTGIPSLYGYGKVLLGSQRQDKRNAAQRGLDAIQGLLTFRSKGDGVISESVSRRYSFPLRAGHRAAYMTTETTVYRYVEDIKAPKTWFKANLDTIMQAYGAEHRIQREELFLIIGTLNSPDYGLFVSHKHADGQAHFNVFSSQRNGQRWGTFTTDTDSDLAGPSYHEEVPGNPLSASKISRISSSNARWDTLIVARLRFKPDALDPTSL